MMFSYIIKSTIQNFVQQTKQGSSHSHDHHTYFSTDNGDKVYEHIHNEVNTYFSTINDDLYNDNNSLLIFEDLSFSNCAPFILEATIYVVDVIKLPTGPHLSCCKAILSSTIVLLKFINIFLAWM